MAEFQPSIAGEYEFENWVKLTKVALFGNYGLWKTLMQGTQIDLSPSEKISTFE